MHPCITFRRFGLLSGGLAGAMLAVAPSCQNPTQIELEIRTLAPLKCSELRGVSIVVAKGPDEAEAKLASGFLSARATCRGDDAFTFGTLVITPSEANGAIVIAAPYGPNAECKPPYESCILARRRFSFVDHVSLKLRVDLEASCVGAACDTLSTCKDARCVSSEVTCDADGRCALKSDASVDAGVPRDDGGTGTLPDGAPRPVDGGGSDAGVSDGGGGDGGPTNFCPLPAGPTECGSGQICCGRTTTFDCAAPPACTLGSEYKLGCTGRKGCPDPTVCCYFPQSKTTICQPVCGNGLVLCSSDQDCPAGRKCTTTPAVNVVSYQVFGCEPL